MILININVLNIVFKLKIIGIFFLIFNNVKIIINNSFELKILIIIFNIVVIINISNCLSISI